MFSDLFVSISNEVFASASIEISTGMSIEISTGVSQHQHLVGNNVAGIGNVVTSEISLFLFFEYSWCISVLRVQLVHIIDWFQNSWCQILQRTLGQMYRLHFPPYGS
jgi:hypothetical protein